MHFFWGLYATNWNTSGTLQTYSIDDIMKVWRNTGGRTNAHCVPRTLDGETGWTCKVYKNPWRWDSPERTCRVGGSITGATITCRPTESIYSTKYRMGKTWANLKATAEKTYGVSKGRYFQTIGRTTKVEYSY